MNLWEKKHTQDIVCQTILGKGYYSSAHLRHNNQTKGRNGNKYQGFIRECSFLV